MTSARTPDRPRVESQRGKEQVRQAAKREGMYRDALQVLLARRSQNWPNPSFQGCKIRPPYHACNWCHQNMQIKKGETLMATEFPE
jgi:hypothetical protein